jgi:trehalose/maltose hydrolase-like predicted phosphorylase
VDGFLLGYDGFDPEAEALREALTSTGNGYLCTRGAAEWEDADGVHYPGTYVHGGYNRETTILGGQPVLNEDLVNLPNWLVLMLRIEGEDAIRLADVALVSYRHELDIRNVTLVRQLRFRDAGGRETTLKSRRFVSMADIHHAGIEWTLVPENWSGRVEVVSALDGRVSNRGVARYRQLEGRHLDPRPADVEGRGHRAEGPNPAVESVHQPGDPHPRVQRRPTAAGNADALSDGGLRPAGPGLRRPSGHGHPGREDGVVLHLTGPRGQRHTGESGGPARRVRRLVPAP